MSAVLCDKKKKTAVSTDDQPNKKSDIKQTRNKCRLSWSSEAGQGGTEEWRRSKLDHWKIQRLSDQDSLVSELLLWLITMGRVMETLIIMVGIILDLMKRVRIRRMILFKVYLKVQTSGWEILATLENLYQSPEYQVRIMSYILA